MDMITHGLGNRHGRLSVALGLWLTLVVSAYGHSDEISVTATNLDQYNYRFSASTNPAPGGVSFHVTVIAKRDDIPADSKVGISIVTHKKDRDGESRSIAGVKLEIPVSAKKEKRVWEVEFTVSFELLEKPGLCFVFTEFAHETIDGKTVAMPSADFYEIKLLDFLKQ
jgi:hypothetical protein